MTTTDVARAGAAAGAPMLHFSREEFAGRLHRLRAEMARRELGAMLLFAQESMYWLTGYDTFGFCFFQCLIAPAEGEPILLTRSADLRQAEQTSTLKDIRVWRDAAGADPAVDLRQILEECGLKGAKIGLETETQGLTAANGRRLMSRLTGWASVVDASEIVPALRLTKSPAEIAYVRRAAEIGDAAFTAAEPFMRPGEDEGVILAAMQGEVFARGGDYAGNEFIIGSGPRALLCRYASGRRKLDDNDQLTLEWAGAYRRYHAAVMRTVVIGEPRPEHLKMHEAARAALFACEAALRPGATMGAVFAAHAETLDSYGFGHARLNACGYALGASFTPCWMEPQMFVENAPTTIGPNMVFFLHMILMDSQTGAAMSLGRTSLVTTSGAEPLSKLPLE